LRIKLFQPQGLVPQKEIIETKETYYINIKKNEGETLEIMVLSF